MRLLVTNRAPLGVPHEHVVRLGPLDPAAGAGVFRHFAAATPLDDDAGVARLVAVLEGNPLMLRLAATRALAFSPDELARHVEVAPLAALDPDEGAEGGAGLRACLQVTWDLLAEPERDLLGALACFEDAFDLDDVAAFTGERSAMAAVTTLVRHAVLEAAPRGRERGTGYHLRRSVRAFVHERIPPTDALRGAHVARVVARPLTREAATRYSLGRPDMALLASASADLRVAFEHALGRDDEAAAVAGLALARLFTFHGPQAEAAALLERLTGALGDAAPPATRAQILRARSRTLYFTGRRREALDDAQRAVDLARAAEDPAGLATSLLGLAGMEGDAQFAAAHLDEALTLARAVADRPLEALALLNRAIGASRRADWQAAVRDGGDAVAILEAHGAGPEVGATRMNFGLFLVNAGDPRALPVLERVLAEAGDDERVLISRAWGYRALALHDLGRLGQARAAYADAARRSAAVGDAVLAAWNSAGEALALLGLGDAAAAVRGCRDAVARVREGEHDDVLCFLYGVLSEAQAQAGEDAAPARARCALLLPQAQPRTRAALAPRGFGDADVAGAGALGRILARLDPG